MTIRENLEATLIDRASDTFSKIADTAFDAAEAYAEQNKRLEAARDRLDEWGASARQQIEIMADLVPISLEYGIELAKTARITEEFANQIQDASIVSKELANVVRFGEAANLKAEDAAAKYAETLRGGTSALRELNPQAGRLANLLDGISDKTKRAELATKALNTNVERGATVFDKMKDRIAIARVESASMAGGFDILGTAGKGAAVAITALAAAVAAATAKIIQYTIEASKAFLQTTPKGRQSIERLNDSLFKLKATVGLVATETVGAKKGIDDLAIAVDFITSNVKTLRGVVGAAGLALEDFVLITAKGLDFLGTAAGVSQSGLVALANQFSAFAKERRARIEEERKTQEDLQKLDRGEREARDATVALIGRIQRSGDVTKLIFSQQDLENITRQRVAFQGLGIDMKAVQTQLEAFRSGTGGRSGTVAGFAIAQQQAQTKGELKESKTRTTNAKTEAQKKVEFEKQRVAEINAILRQETEARKANERIRDLAFREQLRQQRELEVQAEMRKQSLREINEAFSGLKTNLTALQQIQAGEAVGPDADPRLQAAQARLDRQKEIAAEEKRLNDELAASLENLEQTGRQAFLGLGLAAAETFGVFLSGAITSKEFGRALVGSFADLTGALVPAVLQIGISMQAIQSGFAPAIIAGAVGLQIVTGLLRGFAQGKASTGGGSLSTAPQASAAALAPPQLQNLNIRRPEDAQPRRVIMQFGDRQMEGMIVDTVEQRFNQRQASTNRWTRRYQDQGRV